MERIITIITTCLFLFSCGDKEYDDDISNDTATEVYSATFSDIEAPTVREPELVPWSSFHKTVWGGLPTYLMSEIDTMFVIDGYTAVITDIILEINKDATLRIEKCSLKKGKNIIYKKRSYGCPQGEYEFKEIGEDKVNFTITVKSDGAYIDNFGGHDVWNLIPLPYIELEKTDKIVELFEESPKVIVFEQTRAYTPTEPMIFENDEYKFAITMAELPKVQEFRPQTRSFTFNEQK